MAEVELFTIRVCPYCSFAKQLLQRKRIPFEEHDPTDLSDDELRRKMLALSGWRTVPQIVIGGHPVGGCDDLRRLAESGELDRLLAAEQR